MQITFTMLIFALLGTAVGIVIVANFFFYAMIGEVNGRSGPNEQLGMFGVNVRILEVFRRHKALFPTSSKRTWMLTLAVVGIGVFFLGIALGIAYS